MTNDEDFVGGALELGEWTVEDDGSLVVGGVRFVRADHDAGSRLRQAIEAALVHDQEVVVVHHDARGSIAVIRNVHVAHPDREPRIGMSMTGMNGWFELTNDEAYALAAKLLAFADNRRAG